MKVFVLHGPNLHLLGRRQPELYGRLTLRQLDARLKKKAAALGLKLRCAQSNSEGGLIDLLTAAAGWADAFVVNPAAYTHYSYALRDALEALGLPAVEVHLTDISRREPFRRLSVIKPVCRAQFKGKGAASYEEALDYCASNLRR
jgi:3-dehydroquinate dehydratase type II